MSAVVLLGSGIRYGTRHRFPISWDEAMYVNQIVFDRDTLVAKGPLVFARKQIGTERWRPPAYRLAAAPIALVASPTAPVLRMLSLASLALTALLLLLAGRELAGTASGVIWAAAFAMAVGPFEADLLFGTETPLYPALAGTALAIARWFRRGTADRWTGAILFLATVVGALSKLTFLVVFVPFILAAMALAPVTGSWFKSRLPIGAAVGLGVLAVSPWWLYNWREAVHYASYASNFIRGYVPWLGAVATELLGWPLAIGIFATLAWAGVRWREVGSSDHRAVRRFVIACLAGSLPLLALHLMSDNHNMRLLTPALLPAAGIIPLLLHLAGGLQRPLVPAAIALVMVTQAASLAWKAGREVEPQADWNALREVVNRQGIRNPLVMQLGLAMSFNPPQIIYAWRSRGEPVRAKWLWRWEAGPIDWTAVFDRVDSADVILTSVWDGGGQLREDNQHNRLFARRLLDRGWRNADTLDFTASGTPPILVFFRQPRVSN